MPRLLFLLLLCLLPLRAHADGMMTPRLKLGAATDLVASPKQEALLIHDGATVTVFLRTHFTGTPDELAWIVPVPATPTDIATADDAVFADLNATTAPTFYVVGPELNMRPSFGCSDNRLATPVTQHVKVTIEATGTAGIFDYTALSAAKPADLTNWLRRNDFAIPPDAEPTFAHYIAAGYHFLALKLRPDLASAAKAKALAPTPIRYRYRADTLTFPLIISRLSAAPQNEIVVYVLAQSRHAATNFTNAILNDATLDRLALDPTSPSGTTYEAAFLRATGRDPHFLVTECVATNPRLPRALTPDILPPGPSLTLTRLRTVLTPEAMDRDLLLAPVPTRPVDNRHMLPARSTAALPATATLTLLGLSLPLAARGRLPSPRLRRASRLLVLPAALLLLLL